jgi:hypothetical protein
MTRRDPVLADHERMDLATRVHGRLDEPRRRELGRRVLVMLYRQGKATLAHLRAAGVSQADIDAERHGRG